MGNLQNLPHPVRWDVHASADLLAGRLAPVLLDQSPGDPQQLVDRFDHVNGYADSSGLVGDGTGDGLSNPPRRVGGELVAFAIVELFDRANQADVALLDQVQQGHSPTDVLLGDAHDESEVGLGKVALGAVTRLLGHLDVAIEDYLIRLEGAVELWPSHNTGKIAYIGVRLQSFEHRNREEPAAQREGLKLLFGNVGFGVQRIRQEVDNLLGQLTVQRIPKLWERYHLGHPAREWDRVIPGDGAGYFVMSGDVLEKVGDNHPGSRLPTLRG